MNKRDAKRILAANRPNRPQKSEKRQLQQAIDVAIGTIDAYDNLLKAVSIDIRSKWRKSVGVDIKGKWHKDFDTLKCTNCGFAYTPTSMFFMNDTAISHPYIFKHCPNCGEKMGYDK